MTLDRALSASSPARTWSLQGSARRAVAYSGVFLGARIVTSAFLLWITTRTTALSEAGVAPSFAKISSVWDGRWYELIAFHGYPSHLPLTAQGQVAQNAWAFLPAYPAVTRFLSLATGGSWAIAGVVASVIFGVGAAVLLGLLLAPRVGARRALFSVALFSCSPVSFMLQMTYADSMMLCLLFGALYLLERHRYGAAIPIVLVASLTRPGVLAFALACGVHVLQQRRAGTQSRAKTVWSAALVVVSCAGGLAWPVIVSIATGDPSGYVKTEIAWRALWMGDTTFALFRPWLFASQQVLGIAGIPVLGLLIGAAVYFVARPARVLGTDIRVWLASYGLYLLAVFMPQTSLPRLLLPLSPALGAVRAPKRRSTAIAILAVSTAVQFLWLWCTYGPVKTFLTVP